MLHAEYGVPKDGRAWGSLSPYQGIPWIKAGSPPPSQAVANEAGWWLVAHQSRFFIAQASCVN
jgi:hypothetical protein